MRWNAFHFGVASTCLLLAVGCSRSDGVLETRQQPGSLQVPAGAAIADVVAGADVGWVFVVGGDLAEGQMGIWRVSPSEDARLIDTVEQRSGAAAAIGDGLVVARTTCSSDLPQCTEDGGAFDLYDTDGNHVARIDAARSSEPGTEATARIVAGDRGDTAWIDQGQRLLKINQNGEELDRATATPGSLCDIAGEIVAVDPPNATGAPATGDGPQVISEGDGQAPVTFTARRWDRGRWIDGGQTTVASPSAEVGCADGKAAILDVADVDRPLAQWSPHAGWQEPPTAPAFTPGFGGALRTTSGQVFAVDPSGRIVVRNHDDLSFAPVDTEARATIVADRPPPGIAVDVSSDVSLACTWTVEEGDDGAGGPALCLLKEL